MVWMCRLWRIGLTVTNEDLVLSKCLALFHRDVGEDKDGRWRPFRLGGEGGLRWVLFQDNPPDRCFGLPILSLTSGRILICGVSSA